MQDFANKLSKLKMEVRNEKYKGMFNYVDIRGLGK